VGDGVGKRVGILVGKADGAIVGDEVGAGDGATVGEVVGDGVGPSVGALVGYMVGYSVAVVSERTIEIGPTSSSGCLSHSLSDSKSDAINVVTVEL